MSSFNSDLTHLESTQVSISCPNCGTKLSSSNAHFCSSCGQSLEPSEKTKSSDNQPIIQTSIFELGTKLELAVDKIFQSKGFETECRKRVLGKDGQRHEIDVIAIKGNRIYAIECKNWVNPVGIEQIRNFWAKLQEIGTEWNGIFVSLAGFTEPAEKYAEAHNIDRLDQDFLKEELLAVSVGRAQYANCGETKTVKNALPLNFDFFQVTEIGLSNRDLVSIDGMLSYHPYFMVDYFYKEVVNDPTKTVHRFKDSGKVIVDSLDGNVLNSPPSKGTDNIKRKLKLIVSKDAREENRRNMKLIEEMQSGKPVREYNVRGGENYKVRIVEPVITPRVTKKIAIDYIVEKNRKTIHYRPKSQDDLFTAPKTKVHVPKRRNIGIKSITLVNLPRWDISFEVLNKSYSKEVLASSGTVLEDTLTNCSKHTGPLKKQNVAFCEVCGQALCDNHIFRCPVCSKWLCEEHGVFCENCKQLFCSEHIDSKCDVCGAPICSSCKVFCPLCNRQYGIKHSVRCSECNTEFCPECVEVTGFIRKKRTCKKCQL